MTVITLTTTEFANMLRVRDTIMAPVAIGGYLYAVVRGMGDENIYRVAIT